MPSGPPHVPQDWTVLVVPPDLPALAPARAHLAEVAEGWGVSDMAALRCVLSELLTNAVVHAHGPVVVALCRDGGVVRIEVSDDRPHLPVSIAPRPDQESGFGLRIVDVLCSAWGAEPGARSKVVWAELPIDPLA